MDSQIILSQEEETVTLYPSNDSYTCNSCPYPVEILKIDDSENTIIFKCLNPKEKGAIKEIPIKEYLDSMEKYTYKYSECSICHKKQNEYKDIPIFSYCTKCDAVICSDHLEKHLRTNEKCHQGLSSEYVIIKNNEKTIKCMLHPKEKNIGFFVFFVTLIYVKNV